MTPAYVQHKKGLQALQVGQPTEAWSLKTPNHLWCLETLLEFYPDARLIWAHRDPGPVTTSVASLNATCREFSRMRSIRLRLGRTGWASFKHAIRAGMEYDERAEEGWCVHVQYSEMMRDPLAAMRKIYGHFGEEPSALHERRIEAWLREKPQTASGRHAYDPKDFGWTLRRPRRRMDALSRRGYGIERER